MLETKAKAEAIGEDEITKAYYERMICVGGWEKGRAVECSHEVGK